MALDAPPNPAVKTASPSSPPPPRVLLFDLDETLWDCMKTIRNAATKTQEQFPFLQNFETGIKPLIEEFPEKSFDYTFLRKTYLERENPEGTSKAVVDEQFDYWHKWRNTPFFFDNVVPQLRKLQKMKEKRREARNYPLIIGAVTDGNADVFQVEEVKDLFDFSVCAIEVGACKPSEKMFQKALEKARNCLEKQVGTGIAIAEADRQQEAQGIIPVLQKDDEIPVLHPADCLMIGDDFAKDIVGAKQNGMQACWIRNAEKRAGTDMLEITPEYEFETVVELIEKILLVLDRD
ncbi:unnamed protein product [Amoebophrya sp. A120]|nr:unnamed protein product [Amoebophrya sp. A120]|eukprot:GSA120T00006069001.1